MKKRVLIIDNDTDVLYILKEALMYEGFDVITENDTANIGSLISNCHPNVLLIDYILDGVNGADLCHTVKTDNGTSALPVIIMSAYPKARIPLDESCCNYFLEKPFDLDELTNCVKRFC